MRVFSDIKFKKGSLFDKMHRVTEIEKLLDELKLREYEDKFVYKLSEGIK